MRTDPFDDRRIGLIVPSSNTVVEVDFARNLSAGASLHTARMFLAETTEPAEREMIDRYLPQAATDLASLYPDVVVFACTSFRGLDARPALRERFGVPVVTSNQATIVATLDALALPLPDRLDAQ